MVAVMQALPVFDTTGRQWMQTPEDVSPIVPSCGFACFVVSGDWLRGGGRCKVLIAIDALFDFCAYESVRRAHSPRYIPFVFHLVECTAMSLVESAVART